ncbi:hypothetical protein D3C77_511790 [compost metagenome]
MALVGGLSATVLNSYLPLLLQETDALSEWRGIGEGMQVRVSPVNSQQDYSGYRAVAQVEVRQGLKLLQGQALFRDDRQMPPGYQGSVRQLCELLDYRYSRYSADPGYLLNPFIIRGLWADTQVWVPASERLMRSPGNHQDSPEMLVVVRRYPLVSLVWIGFVAMLLGTVLLPRRRSA